MPGHNPHRIEGKAKDAERQFAQRKSVEEARERPPPEDAPDPTRFEAKEQLGGSRPGVPSRVKDAIADRED